MDEFITTREAAERLEIPYQTFMGWLYRGRVAFRRRGWHYDVLASSVESLRQRAA